MLLRERPLTRAPLSPCGAAFTRGRCLILLSHLLALPSRAVAPSPSPSRRLQSVLTSYERSSCLRWRKSIKRCVQWTCDWMYSSGACAQTFRKFFNTEMHMPTSEILNVSPHVASGFAVTHNGAGLPVWPGGEGHTDETRLQNQDGGWEVPPSGCQKRHLSHALGERGTYAVVSSAYPHCL